MAKEILGKLEKEGYKLLITWKPYELHPQGFESDLAVYFPPINANDYIKEIWKRIEKIANENDIPIQFPSALSKSRLALEAAEFARTEPEKFEKFHDLIFKAYFLEKKDIEKIKVVLGVAVEAGLNTDELKEVLETKVYTPVIEQSKQEAISYGINGVPAFIAGSVKKVFLTGCQSISTFKEILDETYRKNAPK